MRLNWGCDKKTKIYGVEEAKMEGYMGLQIPTPETRMNLCLSAKIIIKIGSKFKK